MEVSPQTLLGKLLYDSENRIWRMQIELAAGSSQSDGIQAHKGWDSNPSDLSTREVFVRDKWL